VLAGDIEHMTVPYEEVGKLARKIYDMLLPLTQGSHPVASITMKIRSGPLSEIFYNAIDDFVVAIDALPNPLPKDNGASSSSAEFQSNVMQSMRSIIQEQNALASLVKDLTGRVAVLEAEKQSEKEKSA